MNAYDWNGPVRFKDELCIFLAVANVFISLGIVSSFAMIMMAIYRQVSLKPITI